MRAAVILAFLFVLPSVALAVQINEMMYDLPGSDTGREWIEVYQEDDDCVNLTQWKLFEANANHGLTLKRGEAVLCHGMYAVIADDADKFLLDHIDYSGNLFDSSFSLSNTGETLALKNPGGDITDSVTYSSASGANGNGKSLERNSTGWFESLVNATPGTLNSIVQQTGQNQSQRPSENASQSRSSPQNPQPNINSPSNYSPLIDFSIIGRSNRVPPGSSIEVVLTATSNYLVGRDVSFCSYAKSGDLASDEACRSVSFAADETKELRLYNTLKPEAIGNLTLFVELRDGISTKQKTAALEVLSPKKEGKISEKSETGPTGDFVVKKSDWLSDFIAWLKGLFGL